MDALTLARLLNSGQVVLIDVREPHEFNEEHIQGAVSIPLSVFENTFRRTDYPADTKIVLQCQGGVRSMKACDMACHMAQQGHYINLAGGLNAWKSAGQPVVKYRGRVED